MLANAVKNAKRTRVQLYRRSLLGSGTPKPYWLAWGTSSTLIEDRSES